MIWQEVIIPSRIDARVRENETMNAAGARRRDAGVAWEWEPENTEGARHRARGAEPIIPLFLLF